MELPKQLIHNDEKTQAFISGFQQNENDLTDDLRLRKKS